MWEHVDVGRKERARIGWQDHGVVAAIVEYRLVSIFLGFKRSETVQILTSNTDNINRSGHASYFRITLYLQKQAWTKRFTVERFVTEQLLIFYIRAIKINGNVCSR